MPKLLLFLSLLFSIVQQPVHHPGYVSSNLGEVTQFSMAYDYGNVGLLAHDNLAGSYFDDLKIGDEIQLSYGDGRIEKFVVKEIIRYQALQPYSPYSQFVNLNDGKAISAESLFKRVYFGSYHLTLQTCIEANGNTSWGRLFVIAYPILNVVRAQPR